LVISSDGGRAVTDRTGGRRLAYERSLLAEIRMLLDYVAADPETALAELTIPDPGGGASLRIGAVLPRLDMAERSVAGEHAGPLAADDAALLLLLRDALVRKTRPASGLTVAYTALVSGNRRGEHSESRASLATEAYPGLVDTAWLQRMIQRLLLVLALLVTAAAAWESAKVALGRSLLQSLDGLRTQQAGIAAEKTKLEAALDKPAGGPVDETRAPTAEAGELPLTVFSLCNRPYAMAWYEDHRAPPGIVPPDPGDPTMRLKMYVSSAERDVCERDLVLGFGFSIVHHDLDEYRSNWTGMVGSVFQVTGWMMGLATSLIAGQQATDPLQKGADDVEFVVAPMLLVWGNYVLPVIFGLLGSTIYVILDFYSKLRASCLHPRDTWLGPIRLVLGLVTGACVGLFFSASGPTPGGGAPDLASSLSLSASGIAFLAGFGVEGVFNMLDGLVHKIFTTSNPAK
jgi:hypothetical protein